ncbi:hypothetical protein [Bacteroides sp.]|uniref:hypothetical protein n=1 Tax=Bacteroides sp. TaxID=29523 RepID=UPI0025BDEDEF|nr:hypothetical protein [Bacteroides sp.]
MKKSNILILLAGLSLGSCTQIDDGSPAPEPTVKGGEKSITATCSTATTTRTSLNASMNVVWNQNDEIRLFGASTPGGAVYATTANGVRTAVFEPVDASVEDANRYAVYPSSAASGSQLEGTTLAVDFSALAGQKWMGAFNADSEISSLPMVAASNDETFSFKNLCGGVRLQLNNYQLMGISIKSVAVHGNDGELLTGVADVNAADGIVSLRKGAAVSSALVTCDTDVSLSADNNPSAHTDFVVFLPAVNYAKGLTFVITDAAGRVYEQTTPGAFTIESGVVKAMELLPVTLYYGTANCYRTASAGTLDIDITPYYSLAGDYTYENRQRVNAGGELVDKAASAAVIWTQTNSSLSGNVLSAAPALEGTTLKVPVSGVKGNALVAIRDAAGKNLWSFHIWVSEASDLTYINEERGTFKMMDRNLGATSVTPKDQNAYGAWYQWGRKDPFPRPLDIVRSSATTVDNKELTANTTTSAEVGTVAYAVANPDTRILSANDWHNEWRNNGLWGNPDGLTKNIKTVYDPCPEGYCVPDQNCYQGFVFTSKTECDTNYGHLFVFDGTQTTYFPTGGYLDKSANKIAYQEYRGYQWTNNPGTTGAYYFYYNNANLNFTGMDRASAASVRCVRIE